MKYTLKQFREDFPNEDTCLRYLLEKRYKQCSCGKRTFYKVRNRKCFACSCGKHIYPTAGTIFHKSSTPLTEWFYAIYLISTSKNGVAAAELQRHLGVSYKTAWRMMHLIRTLMKQDTDLLSGIVEADEVYIGGRRRSSNKWSAKAPVLGVVERGGKVKTKHVVEANTGTIIEFLGENVQIGSRVMTDGLASYRKVPQMGLFHEFVEHKNKKEYVRGDVYTNTIEGFWGQLKRSLHGTYHSVSEKHLQAYLDEFSWRYSNRKSENPFSLLCENLSEPLYLGVQRSLFAEVV